MLCTGCILTSWHKWLRFPCWGKFVVKVQSHRKMSPPTVRMAVHIVVCTRMVLLCVSGVSPLDLLHQWPGNTKSTYTHHLFPLISWYMYLVQYLSDIIHCQCGVWGNRVMCNKTLIKMSSIVEVITAWLLGHKQEFIDGRLKVKIHVQGIWCMYMYMYNMSLRCILVTIIPYPRERGPTTEYRPTPHFGLNFLLRSNVYSNMRPQVAALNILCTSNGQGHWKQFRSGKTGQRRGVVALLVRMRRLCHEHLLMVMVVMVITVKL